jgi:two-component system, OmpR family, response regulator
MRAPPARVLVIQDEPAIRDGVITALAEAGYLARGQADGTRLREIVGSFRPELAILDIMLPGGLSLARELRARDDLPVLFLTGRDGLDDRPGRAEGCAR